MLGLDLTGKLVVAVGGGAVSQARVGDLVARGARVRVVSPAVTDELRERADAGQIEWLSRPYAGPPDLLDAWLVHTATGDGAVDGAVAADATTYRIWCVNASSVDEGTARTPARASVSTPDGPVEVAVTASGDPRRAASVRRQIEASLRRGEMDLRRRRARAGAGWVALVGGGPGADGLLTLRGQQLLACADVVVVDRLAPRGVLAELPDDVRVIDVGKDVGFHAVPQQRINEILVEEALAGRGVVRLKGGDPYVLGRGGEERLACEAAGVPVEVVAGVSSAISVPAAAGIPVTHRGLARSFTVVTGHDQVPSLPTGADHTLVVLMGVARLRDTAAAMIASGRSADCPSAVIERGLLPGQRTTVATLGELADRAAEVGVRSPAVVVIGSVVTMAPEWSRQASSPTESAALPSAASVASAPLSGMSSGGA